MKKIISLFLVLSLLSSGFAVLADDSQYDGMTCVGYAIVGEDGGFMVPIRACFEAFGYTVTWDGEDNSIHIVLDGIEQGVFTVGSSFLVTSEGNTDLGAPVVNKDGTTYFSIATMGSKNIVIDPSTLGVYMKVENVETVVEATPDAFVNNLTKTGSGLAREVPADSWSQTQPLTLTESSDYMRWAAAETGEADIRWLDCVKYLSEGQKEILAKCAPNITFNSDTVFPDTMPEDYDPAAILEAGKNPGLGVRSLQEQGITGKGVGIAIIDQTLYTGHPEYSNNLALYEEIHVTPDEGASMHGSAVASIAVGKSCGVAPGAKLYYWAVNLSKSVDDYGSSDAYIAFAEGLAVAIDRVLEVNATLPDDEKIRVISISRGFSNLNDEGVKTFLSAVERAKAAGIFVITTSTSSYYDWLSEENDFGGLSKVDFAGDADSLSNYTLGTWELSNPDYFASKLLVPMDARTVADFTEGDGYVFYSDGGWSWVAPYLAGLYALACQVKSDVTPEEFWKAALSTSDELNVKLQTGETVSKGTDGVDYTLEHVINPVNLIEALKG